LSAETSQPPNLNPSNPDQTALHSRPTAPFIEIVSKNGKPSLKINLHAGQSQAWDSPARFTAIIAGTQSGKTCFQPLWLHREITRCGPGDYLAVSPSYPLMSMKLLPEFTKFFEEILQLGRYSSSSRCFTFSPFGIRRTWKHWSGPTKIFFGHGDDPDSLESATAKAAIVDECGMRRFKFGSWEAILRRLSINRGRALLGTTPYGIGWLKHEIADRAKAGDPDYRVVRFKSIDNPAFSVEEYERARRTMPGWRFRMMYQGEFERPAGMIFDCWEDDENLVRADFEPPADWKRYVGLDFGGINTVAVFLAEEPERIAGVPRRLFLYDYYAEPSRSAAEHALAIIRKTPGIPTRAIGGAKGEEQWRREFSRGGLPVHEPDQFDVEVGINRVYASIKSRQLLVSRKCSPVIDDLTGYSREVDDLGNPTEKIEDKETHHFCDSVRYIVGWLNRRQSGFDLL
jgi:hypothetical protein